MGGWRKVTAEKITFDTEGMVVEGVLISVQDTELGVKSYVVATDGDEPNVTFLGTHILDKHIGDLKGRRVQIVYKGEVKTSRGFNVKDFDINVWDSDSDEDKAPEAGQQEGQDEES